MWHFWKFFLEFWINFCLKFMRIWECSVLHSCLKINSRARFSSLFHSIFLDIFLENHFIYLRKDFFFFGNIKLKINFHGANFGRKKVFTAVIMSILNVNVNFGELLARRDDWRWKSSFFNYNCTLGDRVENFTTKN